MNLLIFYVMLPFLFGGITYLMAKAKGHKYGFWYGFALSIVGVIIVGMLQYRTKR